jgi:hypothetical protein
MRRTTLGLLASIVLSAPMSAQAVLVGSLEQIAPLPTAYTPGVDTEVLAESAVGDVTALVQSVDPQLGLGNANTSGCDATDFAGFAAGSIALIQRGFCTFELKAENAALAGAVGVLVFNQGNVNDPSRMDVFRGMLGVDYTGGIPVLALPYTLGAEFSMTPGLMVRIVLRDELVVPEPGTLALLALGLMGIGIGRGRRST